MKSAVDILIDNLNALGFTPQSEYNGRMLLPISGDRMMNKKLIVSEVADSVYFLASDSYVSKAFSSATVTGLFSAVNPQHPLDLTIYKKDKIADLLIAHKQKVGVRYIDQHITISSKNDFPKKLIQERWIRELMKLCEGDKRYKIRIAESIFSIFDFLKSKQMIQIETNHWVYEKKELERLLTSGVKIVKSIRENMDEK